MVQSHLQKQPFDWRERKARCQAKARRHYERKKRKKAERKAEVQRWVDEAQRAEAALLEEISEMDSAFYRQVRAED